MRRCERSLSVKPTTFDGWRLHAIVCLLLDTGLRIDEAITAKRQNFDFDNLLVTVLGKGQEGASDSVLVRAAEGALSLLPSASASMCEMRADVPIAERNALGSAQ